GAVDEGGGDIEERGGRRVAEGFEGGAVDERLEGRTGLARAEREIYVALDAADHSQDGAGGGLEDDDGSVGNVALHEAVYVEAGEALGFELKARVERRFDDEAVAAGEVWPEPGQFFEGVAHEVGADGRLKGREHVDLF